MGQLADTAQTAATQGTAIPYVVVAIAIFFVILYFIFAPDGVLTGSVFYMFFGSYIPLLVLGGLLFWALYVYLPEIADAHHIAAFSWSTHNTGIYSAIAFTVLALLVLFTRVRKSKARRRRRGNLQ
jgi:hypothetical protein